MRAVQVVSLEGPRAVQVGEVPDPDAEGQVLVEVDHAGVSFPDLLQTRGLYQVKLPVPFVPGVEAAGTVRSAPEGSGFAPGDRVAAFGLYGAMAELLAVPAAQVVPLPDEVSFRAGAGAVMNPLTAHFALVHRGRLQRGETVLVHGAAGGLGVATLGLAHALGARTIAVVSSPDKIAAARAAGADEVLLVDGWLEAVRALTEGRGVDVVADPVGGDRFLDSVRSLAEDGRLLVLGFAGGEIPTIAVNRLLLKNVEVVGVNWGGSVFPRPGFVTGQWAEVAPLLASGAYPLVDGESFALDEVRDALLLLEERRATGKVTLAVRG